MTKIVKYGAITHTAGAVGTGLWIAVCGTLTVLTTDGITGEEDTRAADREADAGATTNDELGTGGE